MGEKLFRKELVKKSVKEDKNMALAGRLIGDGGDADIKLYKQMLDESVPDIIATTGIGLASSVGIIGLSVMLLTMKDALVRGWKESIEPAAIRKMEDWADAISAAKYGLNSAEFTTIRRIIGELRLTKGYEKTTDKQKIQIQKFIDDLVSAAKAKDSEKLRDVIAKMSKFNLKSVDGVTSAISAETEEDADEVVGESILGVFSPINSIAKKLTSLYGDAVKKRSDIQVDIRFETPRYLNPVKIKVMIDNSDKGFYVTTLVDGTEIFQEYVESPDAAIRLAKKEMTKLDNGTYDDDIGTKSSNTKNDAEIEEDTDEVVKESFFSKLESLFD